MDGETHIDADAFYRILARTMPVADAAPFSLLPWSPHVDLALFVHRVRGLEPGLYLLARDPARVQVLRAAMRPEFDWSRPDRPGCRCIGWRAETCARSPGGSRAARTSRPMAASAWG